MWNATGDTVLSAANGSRGRINHDLLLADLQAMGLEIEHVCCHGYWQHKPMLKCGELPALLAAYTVWFDTGADHVTW